MIKPIAIGEDALESLESTLHELNPSQILVISDEHTSIDCYPQLKRHLPEHVHHRIPSGEIHKNLDTCNFIWQVLTTYKFDRKGLVINLGGGVLGDMGGFAAATFKRGIRFIQVPTTLLAMVDASVGGKLGVDFNGLKNHIGLFQEAEAVIIWPNFLKTLPERELRSGFAEVIKHSLIADRQAWEALERRGSSWKGQNWEGVIRHSVHIKTRIVKEDVREEGARMALNFGHTIGHAIESFYLKSDTPLLHGEAVAMGMIAESWLSWQAGFISKEVFHKIQAYLNLVYKPAPLPPDCVDTLWELALQDKKNLGGTVRCTFIEGPGGYRVAQAVSREEFGRAILM